MAQTKLDWRLLPVFIVACLVVSGFGGLFQPGEWYQGLNQAPWTPPSITFPIVWGILYLFIAVAGWLIFARGNRNMRLLWVAQLLVNASWSWVFFGMHQPLIALIDISILTLLVATLIWLSFRSQPALIVTGWLLTPYLVWLLIASSLNAYVVIYN
ncbi:TspO/MBR family protein [Arenicella xantha]|uniref:TspO/MBR related protein n=1 Tax=Arenicella xantha TaxID=644221 RepID=A0A395JP25_9GAMM|nr:TspO/MBR family protein [Arenicella xantha]RBP53411.1 TspO/MBR related protein [Arenicella xantha]